MQLKHAKLGANPANELRKVKSWNVKLTIAVYYISRLCILFILSNKMLIHPNVLVNIPENYNAIFDVFRADTPELLDRVYRLRHQVYCVENAFEDPKLHLDGREIDADDDR